MPGDRDEIARPGAGALPGPARLTLAEQGQVQPLGAADRGNSASSLGHIAGYAWDFSDGTVGTGVEVYHTFAAPGAFPVRLTVTDYLGEQGNAELMIAVLPAFRIKCTPETATGPVPLTLQFLAESATAVPDLPFNFTYHWAFGDGTTAEGRGVAHTFQRPGIYTVTFSLVSALVSVDCATTKVNPRSELIVAGPIAEIGAPQTVVSGDVVTLDGSQSTPGSGGSLTFYWQQSSGPAVTLSDPHAAQTTFVAPEVDTETELGFTLDVSDGNGTARSFVIVIVHPRPYNQFPVADAGPDQNVTDSDGDGSETIALDGSGSHDPDGRIVNYRWTEGATVLYDGPNATTNATLALGAHTITLAVTDNNGGTDTDQVLITIITPGSVNISGRVTDGGGTAIGGVLIPSPAPTVSVRVSSKPRTKVRCFWMKLARCHSRPRPNFFAFSPTDNYCASAQLVHATWMFEFWLRPTAISSSAFARACFGRIFSTGWQ